VPDWPIPVTITKDYTRLTKSLKPLANILKLLDDNK
jgi:hypothetical protein